MRAWTKIVLAMLLALALPPLMVEADQETRCTELGAACVGSDTLNTNSYTEYNVAYWGSTNKGSKPLAIEGVVGAVLTRSNAGPLAGYWNPTNSGEAIANLPGGHKITWVLTTPVGQGGQFLGTNYPPATPTARIAFRGYRYYSKDYSFTHDLVGGQDSCPNSSKIIQLGSYGPILDGPSGHQQMYSWTNTVPWTFSGGTSVGDCCWNGPGPTSGWGVDQHTFRGKWIRFEVVVTNTVGPGTRIQIFEKNVTDNTPEFLAIDTAVVTAQNVGVPWDSARATTLKPGGRGAGGRVNEIWFDTFRRDVCTGFVGIAYIAAAAWSTDSGQRIGAAYELEGGGGPPPPPPPPPVSDALPGPPTGLTIGVK